MTDQRCGRPRALVVLSDSLPYDAHTFHLITSRHPVTPQWSEIHRVLRPGGEYLGQHVGPASAFDLIELFLGPLPRERRLRDPAIEIANAEAAGLEIVDLRTAECAMEFYDVGAIVWILRKCVWWVPDFSVEKYRSVLLDLDAQMRSGSPVTATSTRHLIIARKPS